jgi:hypothetical protein
MGGTGLFERKWPCHVDGKLFSIDKLAEFHKACAIGHDGHMLDADVLRLGFRSGRIADVEQGDQHAEDRSPLGYDAFRRTCPSHTVLEMLASKWVYLVVCALRRGRLRNGELARKLEGISPKC